MSRWLAGDCGTRTLQAVCVISVRCAGACVGLGCALSAAVCPVPSVRLPGTMSGLGHFVVGRAQVRPKQGRLIGQALLSRGRVNSMREWERAQPWCYQ